jgi:hypothetical protein
MSLLVETALGVVPELVAAAQPMPTDTVSRQPAA